MKVRCERDQTVFEAQPQPYPAKNYDPEGDKRIICPTCGRAYFYYSQYKHWFSDRKLTILKG